VKKNPILKVKEQQREKERERENPISKHRFGNNNNIEKKKIIPQSSRRSDKKNHLDVIIKSHKQNVKTTQQLQEKQKQQSQQHKKNKIILEKKSMTPTTTTTTKTTTTNKKNGSDVLKGGVKIKVRDSSNKIDKRREIRSEVKRRGEEGGGRGTELRNVTKIPPPSSSTSPHLPQSKQIQSTMDSFSKRVNKGKRK
jgi:DNA topoisomerase VI subunit B